MLGACGVDCSNNHPPRSTTRAVHVFLRYWAMISRSGPAQIPNLPTEAAPDGIITRYGVKLPSAENRPCTAAALLSAITTAPPDSWALSSTRLRTPTEALCHANAKCAMAEVCSRKEFLRLIRPSSHLASAWRIRPGSLFQTAA